MIGFFHKLISVQNVEHMLQVHVAQQLPSLKESSCTSKLSIPAMMLLINVFIENLMKKVKNTKNFTSVSGLLFLRLTCNKTLIQMFAGLHKHNNNIIFNT